MSNVRKSFISSFPRRRMPEKAVGEQDHNLPAASHSSIIKKPSLKHNFLINKTECDRKAWRSCDGGIAAAVAHRLIQTFLRLAGWVRSNGHCVIGIFTLDGAVRALIAWSRV